MQRRFADLNDDQISSLLEVDTRPFFGRSQGIEWSELLKSRRITIVSEAGSGKTYECQKQQERLFKEGEAAFFLELSELARVADVKSLMEPEQRDRLEQWAESSDTVATFFLDAYDELKLTQRKFRTALLTLKASVGSRLNRIRLIVTSRPGPFEREHLAQLFPIPVTSPNTRSFVDDILGTEVPEATTLKGERIPPDVRNVSLIPLDEAAVREFAFATGLKDIESFVADIRKRDAMDFARRPQDLIELCQDWQDHRQVRSHRDQVETNVTVKLKPRDDRAEPASLSAIKAREGAGELALSVLLTKRLTLRHSFGPGEQDGADPALDPAKILMAWTKEERQTLLERPIFSYASYGRVRFHHRSVIEYLAAERLLVLVKAGMTKRALKRLIFVRTAQGIDVIRPSLRPVVAWLALNDSMTFAEALRREPETLISLGDPSSFTLMQRTAILNAFVRRYRSGTWRGLQVASVQTQRFADPSLGPFAKRLWDEGIDNGEMREFLLELTAAGPLPDLADAAVSVFLDAGAPDSERLNALTAILSLQDSRLPRIVKTLALEPGRWTNRVLQYAVVQLFPDYICGDDLKAVLAALKPSKSSIDAITWNWPNYIKETNLPLAKLAVLRNLLHELVVEVATWEKNTHQLISLRGDLIPALAATCLKELQAGVPVQQLVGAAVAAIRFSAHRDYNDDRPVKGLRQSLAGLAADDRERVFWEDDALMQAFHPHEGGRERFWAIGHEGVISIDQEMDRAWILAAVANCDRDVGERHVVLHAALWVTRQQGPDEVDYLTALRSATGDSPELQAVLERFQAQPDPDPRIEAWEKKRRMEKIKQKRKTAKARQSWEDFRKRTLSDPEDAFSDKHSHNTCWNLWTGMKQGEEFREIGWDRSFIEIHFSRDIADRLRRAMAQRWRSINPPLEYERPEAERGNFYLSWHFALACIYAEAEDAKWAISLSAEEAAKAARIAAVKLNGLPHWLADLAAAHPDTVERTLGPDLSAGLEQAKSWSSYLQALRDAEPHLRGLFVPRIVSWLTVDHNPSLDDADREHAANLLSQALHVLLAHRDPELDKLLKAYAIAGLEYPINNCSAITWAQVLLRLDPESGTSELERLFGSTTAPAKALKEKWIAELFGDRYSSGIPVDLGAVGFSPALLLRLVLLAYAHIRQEEDVQHEGTYSPDTRDNAQTGRNNLLGALLDRVGSDAWQAKLQLANDPLLAHFRDRAIALAKESSAAEADSTSFTEGEAVAILARMDVGPKTREDMFALLSDRLDDLEDMLLTDASPRELWARADQEYLLRREIARALDQMSNGTYLVDQEAVTADEKETDVRLLSTASDQQGVIELKRAEGFSGRILFETIFDQLTHKYLAPENRRAGVLVITLSSDRTFEYPDQKSRIGPEEFLQHLKTEATRVEQHLGHGVQIGVRIFDLRPRLTKT